MPADSFIRFEDEDECRAWLPILVEIYKWESEKVSGPWAGRKQSDIRNCTWTKSQMITYLEGKNIKLDGVNNFDKLLERLIQQRHILRIKNPEPRFKIENGQHKIFPRENTVYISRMAEMVRTIGSIHSFTSKKEENQKTHHQLIEGTKWIPKMRELSPREFNSQFLVNKITNAFDNSGGYFLPNGSSFTDAIEDFKLVLLSLEQEFGNLYFSEFQINSIYEGILNSWSIESPSKGLIITAETGAGKTLGFDIPAIVDALIENRMAVTQSREPGLSQLLLYPRNDLAKDQYATLKKYIGRLNDNLIDADRREHALTLAIDAGGLISTHYEYYPSIRKPSIERIPWDVCKPTNSGKINVFFSSNQKYAGQSNVRSASIMVAGIESFRRRLSNSNVAGSLKKNLRRVVLDEIHLSSGIQGSHHSYMMKRLQQICYQYGKRPLTFMGASATIAKPREHTSKIWHCKPNQISHIDSMESTTLKVPRSIMNHILIRTKKGAPGVGTLVDITSAIGHQRRSRDFSNRPPQYKKIQKTIGFADSHDVVGNWYQLSLENERTSEDAIINNPGAHNQKSPYSHWFSRPLEIHPGGAEVCNSCQNMEKSSNPIVLDSENIKKIMIQPNDTLANAKYFEMNPLDIQDGETISVSGLDSCPHLQCGTCWWFAPRTDEIEERPGVNPGHSYQDALRIKKHTSKSPADESNRDSDANHTFRDRPRNGAYPQPYREGDTTLIPHDIVIATPTLEVGIDMSNVTDVITHKAIRNVSSYRQKIGRGGRESGTDSVATTLMSARTTDFLHYRSSNRLIDRPILEPVPMAIANKEVMKTEAYMSVYDWLSKNKYDIEHVVKARPGDSEWLLWGNEIQRNKRQSVLEYCKYAINNKLSDQEIVTAIEIASEHLKSLLLKYPTSNQPDLRICDYISWMNKAQNREPDRPQDNISPLVQQLTAQCQIALTTLAHPLISEYIVWSRDCTAAIQKLLKYSEDSNIAQIIQLSNTIQDFKSLIDEVADENSSVLQLKMLSSNFQMIEMMILQISQSSPDNNNSGSHIIIKQIKQLRVLLDTSYLSGIFTSCSFFQKDSPHVMLGTLFVNPYENIVDLVTVFSNGNTRTEQSTAKDVLKYYLPGMWTFRAFNGKSLRVKSGTLQGDPIEWVEHFNLDPYNAPKVDEFGSLERGELSKIPRSLLADLDNLDILPVQMRFKEVYLENHPSYQNSLQKVALNQDGWVMGYDVDFIGPPTETRRPQSYSTTWDLATIKNGQQIMTHTIPDMSSDFKNNFSVLKHPLINQVFSRVKWGEFEVKRIATCVSRSNGKRIRFRHNTRPAVYIDNFETEGIEFQLSSDIEDRISQLSSSWRELPFDTLSLRFLRAILESNAGVEWSLRYAMNAYVECLVEYVYSIDNDDCPENQFPLTLGHFMDIITSSSLPLEISDRRAAHGIGDKQTTNIRDDILEISVRFSLHAKDILGSMEKLLSEWMKQTFCNTMAVVLKDTSAAYAGVPEETISYSFEISENGCFIHLYDEDAQGSGSMDVVKDYFQIPQEVRDVNEHFAKGALPSCDFIGELERRLLICNEHITQSIAIEGIPISPLFAEWMKSESEQLRSEYKEKSWDICDAKTVREAALHNQRRYFIVTPDLDDNTLDFQRQALELCDSGCPACNGDSTQNAFKGALTEHFTCKSLVDKLILFGPNIDGYMLKNSDEKKLAELSSKPIEPEMVLVFQPEDGGNGLAKKLIHYHAPPIGLNWVRGEENPNPDYLIRHQEVI